MKTLLYILCSLPLLCSAQKTKSPTQKQAQALMNSFIQFDVTVIAAPEEAYKPFANKQPGDIVVIGREVYQVLEFQEVKLYDFGLIFFNGNTISETDINTHRNSLLAKYKDQEFNALNKANIVATDLGISNQTQAEDVMLPEFKAALSSHKPGELFTIDLPQHKYYYVAFLHKDPYFVTIVRVKHATYK